MRAHVIENGVVKNTIVVDSLDVLPGVTLIEAVSGSPGDLWDGTKVVKRPKWASLEEAITARLAEVDALRQGKTFSDAPVSFPDGKIKEIQLRNEFDMSNLIVMSVASLAAVVERNPNAYIMYRTKDDKTQEIKAVEMLGIGMAVLVAKQAVVSAAWAHKDTIRQCKTIEAVEAYDITKGWPE